VAAYLGGDSGQAVNCRAGKKQLLAGGTSGASILALTFLPKCPLCVGMWLSAIGISSAFSNFSIAAAASLLMAVVIAQLIRQAKKHPNKSGNDVTAPGGNAPTHHCCK
jgi:zinc transporter ZupT